jgi:hypothetical protein
VRYFPNFIFQIFLHLLDRKMAMAVQVPTGHWGGKSTNIITTSAGEEEEEAGGGSLNS